MYGNFNLSSDLGFLRSKHQDLKPLVSVGFDDVHSYFIKNSTFKLSVSEKQFLNCEGKQLLFMFQKGSSSYYVGSAFPVVIINIYKGFLCFIVSIVRYSHRVCGIHKTS
jgi:hypothetical protein